MANSAGEASYLLSNSCCRIALGTILPRGPSTPFTRRPDWIVKRLAAGLCKQRSGTHPPLSLVLSLITFRIFKNIIWLISLWVSWHRKYKYKKYLELCWANIISQDIFCSNASNSLADEIWFTQISYKLVDCILSQLEYQVFDVNRGSVSLLKFRKLYLPDLKRASQPWIPKQHYGDLDARETRLEKGSISWSSSGNRETCRRTTFPILSFSIISLSGNRRTATWLIGFEEVGGYNFPPESGKKVRKEVWRKRLKVRNSYRHCFQCWK